MAPNVRVRINAACAHQAHRRGLSALAREPVLFSKTAAQDFRVLYRPQSLLKQPFAAAQSGIPNAHARTRASGPLSRCRTFQRAPERLARSHRLRTRIFAHASPLAHPSGPCRSELVNR